MYRSYSDYASGEAFLAPVSPAHTPLPRRPWLFPRTNDTKLLLSAAHALVGQGWAKGHLATDRDDHRRNPLHKEAYNFCAIGALICANAKQQTPRLFPDYWRRRRLSNALTVMCLAIKADNNAVDDEDRRVLIEKWNDYADHRQLDVGFTVAISAA